MCSTTLRLLLIFLFYIPNANGQYDRRLNLEQDYHDTDQLNRASYTLSNEKVVISKSKITNLGEILKRQIQKLRNATDKHAELVFLIDSSTSVEANNFHNELKFVKKLLSDFTVELDATRVAVVTFSSRHRILRHIDHISHPDKDNHKCALLEEQLPMIRYKGGGTYTLGAMLEAKEIFKNARSDASKSLILVTDGYSNGGDPRQAAKDMRDAGVTVFTFGIRNGNVKELYDMASEPKEEHSYILDSFEEFEALARRALHEDLHVGHYMLQEPQKCNSLCDDAKMCCDSMSTCRCGTHTGHYECICQKGYYGTGLRGDCIGCPSGTYKDNTKPGDVGSCVKCPDINHISSPGSTDISDCKCKKGFRRFGKQACAALTCPAISSPKNGYFVKDKCSNVFNAACGIKCNPGFRLVGSSVRLCQEGGTWSGNEATCQVRKCPKLKIPKHGKITCTRDDSSFGTTCQFTCQAGFTLLGSDERACLAIGFWSGITTRCRGVFCPPLPSISDGRVWPPSCLTENSEYGTDCEYHCNVGFKLSGPGRRQCTSLGVWSSTPRQPRCVDNTPPKVVCPTNIVVDADPGEDSAEVTWSVPGAVDNSGTVASVSVNPALHPPKRFRIGTATVTYFASDANGNQDKCFFKITVKDSEPPRVDKCTSPADFLADSKGFANVTWEEPLFSDNSGEEVRVESSRPPGQFPFGKTSVAYTAYDKSGNSKACGIVITVREDVCVQPLNPFNGVIGCFTSGHTKTCEVSCNPGFEMAFNGPTELSCSEDDGIWYPGDRIPDCAETRSSNNAVQPTRITFRTQNTCRQKNLINEVVDKFHNKISNKLSDYCNGVLCEVSQVEIHCMEHVLDEGVTGGDNVVDTSRRKRSIHAMESRIQFDFVVKGAVNESRQSPDDVYQTLIERMHGMMDTMAAGARRGDLQVFMGSEPLEFKNITFAPDYPKVLCQLGSVLIDGNRCVSCPVGSYFNNASKTCESCLVGTYQHLEGQLTCLVCPENTSTPFMHSTNEGECKVQCLPGKFSTNGLEPCETCHINYYQPKYGQASCSACPNNTKTWRRGSSNEHDCKDECVPGYVSNSGLEPCFPCPGGYFQDHSRESSCFQCPRGVQTNRTASTSLNDCVGLTQVDRVAYNKNTALQLASNECFTEPCVNGASCTSEGVGFVCICAPGYTGLYCEFEIDECVSLPCLNAGTCRDELNNFTCLCPSGFTGHVCEVELDECDSSPCQNEGTCVDMVNEYKCLCIEGYQGVNCEWDVDECRIDPCLNGATCEDLVGRFNCVCPLGFTGNRCEVNTDECESSPCQHDGTCLDGVNLYRCVCPLGYTGSDCEKDIDECASNPCKNGATCIDQINKHHCKCKPSFTGQTCETELDPYFYLSFRTSGTMDHVSSEDVPTMTAISVAFWMRSNDKQNYGTPFSYASSDIGDNAFTITDYNGFVIYANGDKVITDVATNDGYWHHVCVTWSKAAGFWQIYKDGVLSGQGYNLAADTVIPGGGMMMLGQEQDILGGSFSAAESFLGNLTMLNVWDSVLSHEQVEKMVSTCNEYKGTVKAWPDFLSGMKGRVQKLESNFCKSCPEPYQPRNGATRWKTRTLDSVVEYACEIGYTLRGPSQRSCKPYSEWSDFDPICEKVTCGLPPAVTNGYFSGSSYEFGSVLSVMCLYEYYLVGNGTLVCNASGEWTGSIGSCELISCQLPSLAVNLKVIDNGKETYTLHETVSLGCENDLVLSGHDILTCQPGGLWDFPVPICSYRGCSKPPTIEHGKMNITPNKIHFVIDDSVKYSCEKGFEIEGETDIRCLANGSWNQPVPKCLRIRCQVLPNIRNATKIVETDYLFGSTVKYSCDIGFQLFGDGVLECLHSGSWNATLPACHHIVCPTPEFVENGYLDVKTYHFSSTIKYSCRSGYYLVGVAERTCLATKRWSDDKPSCAPVQCDPPGVLHHGHVLGDDFHYESILTYECESGYYPSGDTKRLCQEDQTWSGSVPVCNPVECPFPSDITYGQIMEPRERYVYDDIVRYTCNTGYEIQGKIELLCLENANWSHEPPACRARLCREPSTTANGFVEGSNYTYGSVVIYRCASGYTLFGRQKATCQANAEWSNPTPQCKPISCPLPGNLDNGHVTGTNVTLAAIVSFECNKGYVLDGVSEAKCLPDQTWSSQKPTCNIVKCETPDPIANGMVIGSVYSFNTSVKFSCNEGYTLQGRESMICQENATWSTISPSCKLVSCSIPISIANGEYVGDDYTYSSKIRYTCNQGFSLTGNPVLLCNSDKEWSSAPPSCVPVNCSQPDPLLNGDIVGTNYSYSSSIEYKCNTGFHLVGAKKRICSANRTWDNKPPVCKPINCSEPPKPVNGHVIGSNFTYQSTVLFACDEGYAIKGAMNTTCNEDKNWDNKTPQCDPVTCPAPSPIPHANIIGDEISFNSSFEYQCETGFTLHGNVRVTCDTTGHWKPAPPECKAIVCPVPRNISYGIVIGNNYTFSAKVKYSCDTGYVLVGDNGMTCAANRSWNSVQPNCVRVRCPPIDTLPNGRVSSKNFTFNSTLRFSCNNGFNMFGERTTTCQYDKQWSKSVPMCKPVTCPPPPSIKHGVVSGANYTYTATAQYECNEGYQIVGSTVLKCQANRKWDNDAAKCKVIKCKSPPIIDNGQVTIGNLWYSGIVEYTCKNGFELVGSRILTCMSNKTWDRVPPRCDPLVCPPPLRVEHGNYIGSNFTYTAHVEYKCSNGYRLTGERRLRCLGDRSWSGEAPVCTLITCPTPSIVDHGNTIGSNYSFSAQVVYTCNEGYELIGSRISTCTSNGSWDSISHTCTIVSCGNPPKIANGNLKGSDYSYTSNITYICDEGFLLEGSSVLTCLANKTWSTLPPRCDVIECPAPGVMQNGKTVGNSFSYMSILEYDCDNGFLLNGPRRRICTSNGTWEDTTPVCTRIACPPLTDIPHGVILGKTFSYNSTVRFKCDTGYELNGSGELLCQYDGSWNSTVPKCKPVTCPQPPVVINAKMSGPTWTYNSRVFYKCAYGYEIIGKDEIICLANGTWSFPRPSCQRMECPDPPKVENAIRGHSTFEIGAIVTYNCSYGYEQQKTGLLVCGPNRTWLGDAVECAIIRCPPPAPTPFGHVLFEQLLFGFNAVYSCFPGFELVGSAVRTCLADKTWSDDTPICKKLVCPTLSKIAHGFVSGGVRRIGAKVKYSCKQGFTIHGKKSRECQPDTTWSGNAPTCDVIECGRALESFPNGKVVVSNITYNSTMTYICNIGFRLIGNNVRRCEMNGTWSGKHPSCEAIRCQTPNEVANGFIDGTEFTYGKTIHYRCSVGFALVGPSLRICLGNQQWTGRDPVCELIQCPLPGDIDHGYVMYDSLVYQSVLKFKCEDNYKLRGTDTRVCQLSRSWSDSHPTCVVKECPLPDSIQHGFPVYTGRMVGDELRYACRPMYSVANDTTRICLNNETWSGETPVCKIFSCPSPVTVMHAYYNETDYHVGQKVTYSCQKGYRLSGNKVLTCDDRGSWRGSLPRCQLVRCRMPAHLSHGVISGGKYTYGSVLKYRCYSGFELVGHDRRTCEEDGTWSGPNPPRCVKIVCPKPDDIHAGSIIGATYDIRSKLEYACDPGYELLGSKVIVCLANKTWSAPPAACQRIECPPPPAIENGNFTESLFLFGDAVQYRCYYKYEIVGDAVRMCLPSKTWSGDSPSCRMITCPTLKGISYGTVKGDKVSVGDSVTTTCLRGYELRGLSRRECQQDGSWTGSEPVCVAISCTQPQYILNGFFKGDNFTYMSTVTYGCQLGFELRGDRVLTCFANKTWAPQPPSCRIIKCPTPGNLQNGRVSGGRHVYDRVIRYHCEPGYQLNATNSRRCLLSGLWSGNQPHCQRISCAEPPSVAKARIAVKLKKYRFGDIIEYECKHGYVTSGNTTIFCRATGLWSVKRFTCKPIECPPPEPLAHGKVFGDIHTFEGVLNYTCARGYILVGGVSRECLASGRWNNESPLCERLRCSRPPVVQLARLITTKLEYRFGDTVHYDCQQGYKSKGNKTLLCLETGSWSFPDFVCNPKECPLPEPVQHGGVVGDIFTFGAVLNYTCAEGYILYGDASRECLANQTWSGVVPTCDLLSCTYPDSIEHGFVVGESYKLGDVVTHQCVEGFELHGDVIRTCSLDKTWTGKPPHCMKVSCPTPDTISYGNLNISGTRFEDVVTYKCKPGYDLHGFGLRSCLANKTWSGHLPTCQLVSCGQPSPFPNGYIDGNNFTMSNDIYYNCFQGYNLIGEGTRRCLADKTWSGLIASCVPVSCEPPSNPVNGLVFGQTYTFGRKIAIICDVGYSLIGRGTRECLFNGSWSGEPPKCEMIECHRPSHIRHGRYLGKSFKFRTRIKYQCDPGYDLIGGKTRECLASRTWSGQSPRCVIISCIEPSSIDNGRIIYTNFTFGQKIRYTFGQEIRYECVTGKMIDGPAVRRCQRDKMWSGYEPRCIQLVCNNPGTIRNGRIEGKDYTFGHTITYHCYEGYLVKGTPERTCTSDRSWSGLGPTCQPIVCKMPHLIRNGVVNADGDRFNDSVRYSCDSGYDLLGQSVRTCLRNGAWSGSDPTCVVTTCPIPEGIPHGLVIVKELKLDAEIVYECEPGFEIQGDRNRKCLTSKVWSGDRPHCVYITCPVPPRVDHGHIIGDSFDYNATVQLICDEGYETKNKSTIKCKENKQWDVLSPECVQISCGKPDIIPNTDFISDAVEGNYRVGNKIQYKCQTGYRQSGGITTSTCKVNKSWSLVDIVCTPVKCGKPGNVTNARRIGNDFGYGDTVFYTCNRGYETDHITLLVCQEDGTWYPEYPVCHMVHCGPPPVIPYASTILRRFTYGSEVRYHCNTGYRLQGSQRGMCMENKTWMFNEPARCMPVKCSHLSAPEHGAIEGDVFTFRKVVKFSCDLGYILHGETFVECMADAAWNATIPTCELIQCGKPPVPEKGYIQSDSYRFNGSVAYFCERGYKLRGQQVRICQEDGGWDGSLPICIRVVCEKPLPPENGGLRLANRYLDDRLSYYCLPGYELVGNETVTCGENGLWHPDPPVCQALADQCPAPVVPSNTVGVYGSFRVGDVLKLRCKSGYVPSQDLIMKCVHSHGYVLWTQAQGLCRRVYCGPPRSSDPKVRYMGYRHYYGDRVHVQCTRGFAPVGVRSLTCLESGKWDHQAKCKGLCSKGCRNGGTCFGDDKCRCKPGYKGRQCEQATCILPCLNGGTCIRAYQCACKAGYTGNRCQRSICEKPCLNGGRCTAPNRCQCHPGFLPPYCSRHDFNGRRYPQQA